MAVKRRCLTCAWTVPLMLAVAVGGCGAVPGLSASFGGSVAGGRGTIQAVFINNTPHRVAFTYGVYDPADSQGQPDFGQFVLDGSGPSLAGGGFSDVVTLTCGRLFSIGGLVLLERIELNLPDADLNDDAFVLGVNFFADEPPEPSFSIGTAPPFEAELGVDFPCEALLVLRFELDDLNVGRFRTGFDLIPSSSTR